MKIWTPVALLLGLVLAIGLFACDSPPPSPPIQDDPLPVDPPLPSYPAEFAFRFSTVTETGAGGTSSSLNLGGGSSTLGVIRIGGELLVVPHGETQADEVYRFDLDVDESAAEVITIFNLDLPASAYDFYFLLKTPDTRYGGHLHNQLIMGGGLNAITIPLNPLVGVAVGSVTDFRSLGSVAVRYDPALLATYSRPRVGISIDGAPEVVFAVQVNPEQPEIRVFLSAGSHRVQARFFDGDIVKEVTVDDDVELPPREDGDDGQSPVEVVVVPLTAEATYTFNRGDGQTSPSGSFVFTVPVDVVNEVGGEGALQTVASIVGPENPLQQFPITLAPVIGEGGLVNHYSGQIVVPDFVPGKITWQLRFVDGNNGDTIAFCAESVDTTNTSSPGRGSFVCEVSLLERALSNIYPSGRLQVSVTDPLGLTAGAVVLLDGQPLGVTGGGPPGEPLGTLLAFLPPATYSLQVVDEVLDPFGSGSIFRRESDSFDVTISVDGINSTTTTVPVALPAFPFEAPQISGTAPVNGAVSVNVGTLIAVTFTHPMDAAATAAAFRIAPAVAGTLSWSAGNTVLTFDPTGNLAYEMSYAVSFVEGARDSFGTALVGPRSFHFTTGVQPDTTPPQVSEVTPGAAATNVSVLSTVSVRFSEPMNTGSLDGGVFSITPTPIGSVAWSGGNTVLTFTPGPSSPLLYKTTYTVAVGAAARDLAGNPLGTTFTSIFTTGLEPDLVRPTVVSVSPLPDAEDVPVGTTIRVSFSESMDTGSVESAFNVQPNPGGFFAWRDHNKVVIYTPASELEHNRAYRVVIGTTALDTANNALVGPVDFSFRTVAPPPPPPSNSVIDLVASRSMRPRSFQDAFHDITVPTTVRIPEQSAVRLALNERQEPIGDPNRYLLLLKLGHVRCMYLAGSWDRHLGGALEELFERAFGSPVCTNGGRAGALVTIEPVEPRSSSSHDRGGDDDDSGFERNASEIKARVITSNPHYGETRVEVTIEVVAP